jgi:hypothetical protein
MWRHVGWYVCTKVAEKLYESIGRVVQEEEVHLERVGTLCQEEQDGRFEQLASGMNTAVQRAQVVGGIEMTGIAYCMSLLGRRS